MHHSVHQLVANWADAMVNMLLQSYIVSIQCTRFGMDWNADVKIDFMVRNILAF